MNIHSKFLVHWTGEKDIESKPERDRPQLYLERLIDYYQNGLFAKRTNEAVIRGMIIKNIIRLCFTEIKLSQVKTHAKRYGKLGIGFSRDFIMNKGGRPVIYIPHKTKADGRLLEYSIGNVYNKSKGDIAIHKSSKWIMAYVKRMSNEKSVDSKDYEDYYEEMEWRLVYDEDPANKHFTKEKAKNIRRLMFNARDIKVIVFPDEKIKQMALKNGIIKKYFFKHMPIVTTLDDCYNF